MNPVESMEKLEGYAAELDQLSRDLADVQRRLEPVQHSYRDWMEDFIAGMFEDADGKRLPGEDVRNAVAHKQLRKLYPELLGQYRRLSSSRDRLRDRIDDVARSVSAEQSVLKALRTEMEATR